MLGIFARSFATESNFVYMLYLIFIIFLLIVFMILGSILSGFWGPFGSGTPLQAPLGPEVGGRRLRTGKKSIWDGFWDHLGVHPGPSGALFRTVLT